MEIDDREPRAERAPLLRVARIDRAEFAARPIVTLVVPEGVRLDSYEQTGAATPFYCADGALQAPSPSRRRTKR